MNIYVASSWRNERQPEVVGECKRISLELAMKRNGYA